MKRFFAIGVGCLLPLLAFVNSVHAADETFAEQFLGSPLLILVALVVIAAIAALYHKMRK